MARKPSAQDVFDALLTKYDSTIAQAFLDAIIDLRTSADLARAIKAISSGNTAELIAALHLDPAAFVGLTGAVADAYGAGGASAMAGMPILRDTTGARFVLRFDPGDIRSAMWLRDHSSILVTRILDDQRVMVRNALADGMLLGQNPRTTALDIVGRLNRATGKREGGLVGLTAPQQQFVRTAQQELASGDAKLLRSYLTRKRRDRRFDRAVLQAIENDQHLSVDTIQRAAGRYADRLLQLRGEGIARHESIEALHAAQDAAYDQAIAKGAVRADQVYGSWRDAGDRKVRHTHTVLNGESVRHGEAFVSPSGARMRFPGDTKLGAPAKETAGCRCHLQKRIDFLANIR